MQPVSAANGGNRDFDPPRPWCASMAEKEPVSLTARNRRLSIRDGSGAEMAPIEAGEFLPPLGLARCRIFCSDHACDGMLGGKSVVCYSDFVDVGIE